MNITEKIKDNTIVKKVSQSVKRSQHGKIHRKPKTERICENVKNVAEYCDVISKHGDKIALSYFDKKRVLHDMSYGELSLFIKKISAGLGELGLGGKKIAVIGETSPEWIASYIAILASGSVVIPMDKELQIDVIEGFLSWVEADAIIYSEKFKGAFDGAKATHRSLKYFIPMADFEESCAENCEGKTVALDKIVAMGEKAVNEGYKYNTDIDNDALAELLFTSGTTGTSKAVMLSQKNIFSVVSSACETVDFNPDDVIVSVLPIHHTYELACMLAAFVYGMKVCINDSLTHLLKNFQTFKPTGLVLVPLFVYTMYKRIWAEAKKTGRDKMLKVGLGATKALSVVGIDKSRQILAEVHNTFGGRLEKIICGGAALNPKMIEFFDLLGISIYEGFGITECAPLTCVTPYYARKYGSVGPAVPCCEVRISGSAINELGYIEGEIQVKGDNVMIGYFDNDEANAQVFTEDGWFGTGDAGYMDDDGYVYITGRLKTVIVLENGKNVFPEEIEEYLSQIEEIAECVVVGRAQNRTDNVILTALIYPDLTKFASDISEEGLSEFFTEKINLINKKLPTYKQVKSVEIRKEEFEKTTSRKIKRHLVR